MVGTLGYLNPFRYRGYVYDEETGLYYLRSRYYNPEWGRFVNADVLLGKQGALLTHNLFAYCLNSATMRTDAMGTDSGFMDWASKVGRAAPYVSQMLWAPVKAFEGKVGIGTGFGFSAEGKWKGLEGGLSLSATYTDYIKSSGGKVETGFQSGIVGGWSLGPAIDEWGPKKFQLSGEASYRSEHSFSHPDCNCNWFTDSPNVKMACPAQPEPEFRIEPASTVVGVGGGVYLGLGGEFFFGFDTEVLWNELVSAVNGIKKVWE